jgi:hypothetical protein
MIDFLQRLFLEDIWRLAILSVLVIGATTIAWRRRGDRVRWWVPAGAAAMMAVLFALQHLVVTDREAVRQCLYDLVAACEADDADLVLSMIDDSYNADGLTKDDLRELAAKAFREVDISDVRLLGLEIETEGDAAVTRFAAICRVRWEMGENPYRSRWELHWWRSGLGWRLDWIRPLAEADQPARSLEDLVP